ncbi:MAG: recombinase family protein, partial [Oscillospiraceae bacterium]
FNAQYAKDISEKVRSSFRVKQNRGEFVGAFASYGYGKDSADHNKLVVDPVAARVVCQVFELAAHGVGQIRIAQQLNAEKIPCPSAYKRLMGERYTNSKRLESTCYWTYATIHRMLQNEMYRGSMVQRKSIRPTMHAKAKAAEKNQWVVVPNTHEAIVSQELWDAVQAQIAQNTRAPAFEQNVGLFAGFFKCGDCGRAMVKTVRGGRIHYSCGSYRRYGASVCTKHYIPQQDMEDIILTDLNRVIAAASDLKQIAAQNQANAAPAQRKDNQRKRLEAALERVRRLKRGSYEDYRESLLSREEFLRYKEDYDRQEETLTCQLAQIASSQDENPLKQPWVEELLRLGRLTRLDRATLAQTVEEIRMFEDKRVEITYRFSESLRCLLEEI